MIKLDINIIYAKGCYYNCHSLRSVLSTNLDCLVTVKPFGMNDSNDDYANEQTK